MATVKQAKSLALVSLFTREWIEITLYLAGFENGKPSPSLRGSGLKSMIYFENQTREMSPSLRGSGLKYLSP